MKKIMDKITFAAIVAMTSVPAFAAEGTKDMCDLIEKLHDVFKVLRTLAFVGAAFYIAGWAWGFITAGEVKTDDLKKKGTGLLVGFMLLFIIGVLLSFVLSAADGELMGCEEIILKW